MKSAKKLNLIAALFALLLCVAAVSLTNRTAASADVTDDVAYGESYITADVGEDKVIHVLEKLNIGFMGDADKYERRIPSIGQTGGGRRYVINAQNFTAEVNGGEVETDYTRQGSVTYVYVASPEDTKFSAWTAENRLTYEILLEYDLDMSDDIDGADALEFKFFGDYVKRWFWHGDESNVAKLHVTVNMPKEFEASKAALVADGKDLSEEGGLEVAGKTISFSLAFTRVAGCSLSVELPKDYFSTTLTHYSFYWIFVALFAAIMFAGIFLTVKYRPRKPLATVEFEPPLLNPMHFSAFWHGYARRRDVGAVILLWANGGYVKIKKDGKRDLIITKIKDLPASATAAERGYFNALFEESGAYSSAEMKKREKRMQRSSVRRAVGRLIDEFGEPVTYVNGVERAKLFVRYIPVFTLIVLFLYFIVLSGYYAGIVYLFMASVAMFGFLKLIYMLTDETKGMRNRHMLFLAFGLGFGSGIPVAFGLVLYFAASEMFLPLYDYIYLTVIAIAWIIFSVTVLPKFIGRRTEEAQALYGKMTGFKNFLKLAEVKQMEALLDENPDYYLNVLPYCMIMGLSEKLDKKTEFLQAPDWADGFEAKRFAASLYGAVKRSGITRKKKVKKHEKE